MKTFHSILAIVHDSFTEFYVVSKGCYEHINTHFQNHFEHIFSEFSKIKLKLLYIFIHNFSAHFHILLTRKLWALYILSHCILLSLEEKINSLIKSLKVIIATQTHSNQILLYTCLFFRIVENKFKWFCNLVFPGLLDTSKVTLRGLFSLLT